MRVGETLAERKPNASLDLPAESSNGKGTSLRHSLSKRGPTLRETKCVIGNCPITYRS